MPLVAAHAQPADLFPEIAQVVRIAHGRGSGRDSLDGLGEEVFVGHRHDRHGDPGQEADLRREHPGRVHDDLGLDHRPIPAVLDLDARDSSASGAYVDNARVGSDRHASPAGTGRQRLGEAGRVEPAVGRQEDRAENALGRHQGEALLGLARRDELEREPERLGPARLALQLLVALAARGETQRSDLVPGGVDPRLGRQPTVQLDAVHHHLR